MNRVIEAILKLSSKVGSLRGFDSVSSKLDQVDRKAKTFNRSQTAIGKTSAFVGRQVAGVLAPAAVAYTGSAAFKNFAALERDLTRIGINAGASKERMAEIGDELRALAHETAIPFEEMVDGFRNQIAAGAELEEALKQLPLLAVATQASGSAMADIATTSDAITNSFNLMGKEIEASFDILAFHGKEGKFELNEMARELPALAPAFANLGYEGTEGVSKLGAALQIVRRETGSSSEAATAFGDVLGKMETDTTANKFKDFGIDIRKEMDAIRKSGGDVLEGFIELSREAIDGDMSKIPQLFSDKQMRTAMTALIRHTDDYRKSLVKAGEAAGTMGRDLKLVLNDSQASIDKMANSWDSLLNQVGSGIAPIVTPLIEEATDYLSEGDAVTAGMKKEGLGFLDRYSRFANPNFRNSKEWNRYRRLGGYRTDEEKEFENFHSFENLTPPSNSLQTMPIPLSREQIDAPVNVPQGLTLPDGPPGLPSNRSELSKNPIQDFIKAGGGMNVLAEFERKFQSGGAAAAEEIASGAPQSGAQFGDAASQKITAGAVTAGSAFGDAAAAKINAAAKNLEGAAGRYARRKANANTGATMTDAGEAD